MLAGWGGLTSGEAYAEDLLKLECPLLLVKHEAAS
jgi:hypothetical protein